MCIQTFHASDTVSYTRQHKWGDKSLQQEHTHSRPGRSRRLLLKHVMRDSHMIIHSSYANKSFLAATCILASAIAKQQSSSRIMPVYGFRCSSHSQPTPPS